MLLIRLNALIADAVKSLKPLEVNINDALANPKIMIYDFLFPIKIFSSDFKSEVEEGYYAKYFIVDRVLKMYFNQFLDLKYMTIPSRRGSSHQSTLLSSFNPRIELKRLFKQLPTFIKAFTHLSVEFSNGTCTIRGLRKMLKFRTMTSSESTKIFTKKLLTGTKRAEFWNIISSSKYNKNRSLSLKSFGLKFNQK